MKYIVNNSTDPYFNMALDEYCLEQYSCEDNFFYLWRNRPSVIIGLNQNAYSEVNLGYLESQGISLARRVTGGGAVYHDLQNLNYSFVGKQLDARLFSQALNKLGLDAELTGRNDIFVDGKKVSGYARRVYKDREIIHGTLMYDVDIEALTKALAVPGSKLEAKGIASVRSRVANVRDLLPQYSGLDELQAALHAVLSDGDAELVLPQSSLEQVRRSAEEKFSTWEWIYGHSHRADICTKAKLPCGTVELSLALDRGYIVEIGFGGDFVGALPATEIEAALKGVRYERDEILSVLSARQVGLCFDSTDEQQLTELILNKHI